MQPVVHLVVGYLCYAAYARWTDGEPPASTPAAVAIVAAAIPDLLDKPLYHAGITPVGRTIGHSLLFAVPVVALAWLVARRRGQERLGVAFAIGYGSHVATDIPWHVLAGDYHELGFLLWPITYMPEYSGVKPLGTVPSLGLEATTLWLEAVIFVGGIALWWRDGRPGLDFLLKAGDLARRRNDAMVTEDHVREAKQLLEKQRIEESMKELTSHGHLTLLAVVASTVANPREVPLRKQMIYEQYQDLSQATDTDPLGGRAFHNHLAELSMLGILDRSRRNEGRAGGIYYEYEVDVSLDAALSTLENQHMSGELDLESLRETAREKGLI